MSSGYISFPAADVYFSGAEFSVTFWITPTILDSTNRNIFTFQQTTLNQINLYTNGQSLIFYWTSSPQYTVTGNYLKLNQWTFVALNLKYFTLKFYFEGELVQTFYTTNSPLNSSTSINYIGNSASLQASIFDFKMYNKGISQANVLYDFYTTGNSYNYFN